MDLKKALQELAVEIKDEIIRRLHSESGINPRTGTNTLVGSNLEKSIDVQALRENTIVFKIADYYQYIVTGWRRTGNYPGTINRFLDNILDWVKRKHITLGDMSQNQIVWYLYRRMIVDGREISPRPFINYDPEGDMSKILPFLDDFFERWADNIFNKITEDLDKYFNK